MRLLIGRGSESCLCAIIIVVNATTNRTRERELSSDAAAFSLQSAPLCGACNTNIPTCELAVTPRIAASYIVLLVDEPGVGIHGIMGLLIFLSDDKKATTYSSVRVFSCSPFY